MQTGLFVRQQPLSEEINLLAAKLEAIADKLDAVTTRLDALISNIMAMPRADTQPAPVPSLTLPLPPKHLNEMMLAANIPGHVQMAVYQVITTIPAGTESTLVIPVLPGTVTVFVSPIRQLSTYYSSSIVGSVTVDGNVVAQNIAIVDESHIELGQYYYVTRELVATVRNNSATDIVFSAIADVMAIDRQFFDLFYVPIINYGYSVLRDLAVILNGGREIP